MGKKMGHGFDPEVCEGCPHHTFYEKDDPDQGLIERAAQKLAGNKQGYWGCGLCGCPTESGLLLDRLDAIPEDCPRADLHANDDNQPDWP